MFCSKCGIQLPDDSSFCNECGIEIRRIEMSQKLNQEGQANQTVQNPYQPDYNYEQSPQTQQFTSAPGQINQQYQPYAQPYYVPVYTKPRRPGRGFGISSMILGIIGIVYSFLTFIVAITIKSYNGYYARNEFYEGNVISMIITFSIFAILACIFSIAAIKKRYKNGVSISGLVMSIISIVLMLASTALVVRATAIPSPSSETTNQFWIGKWSLDEGSLILSK